MTIWLKQSTAATIKMGPFVDATDGVTAETGLAIAQAAIRLSKNGGNIAQTHNATGATHDELGLYDIPLDTTDTDTLGALRVDMQISGALPVWQDFMVVPANVWDSMFGADLLQVDVAQLSGDATAADNAEADFDGTGYNHPNSTIPTVTNLTNLPAAAATAAELAKVPKSDSNVSWNATALGAINAEVDTALNTAIPGSPTANSINQRVVAIDDLTQAAGGGDLAAIKLQTDKINSMTEDDAGTPRFTVNALENGPSGSGASAASIADAVLDEAAAGHTGFLITLATAAAVADNHTDIGTALTNLATVDGIIDNIHDTDLPAVKSDTAAILTDTGTTLPAQITGLNNLSAAQVNAEVVDVLRTDTIPDAVAAMAAQPTIAQALYAILQLMTEKSIAGTTMTVNKPDGSTALMTLTLNDAVTPTALTRAT
jgi:hypothetical protein